MHSNLLLRSKDRHLLHASIVIMLFAGLILIFSANSFAVSSPAATGQIDSEYGAYLRKSSSTSSKKLDLLEDGTLLTIYRAVYKSKTSTSESKIWYYVKANGKKGYVRADNVGSINYSMVSAKVKSRVNCRKGPGTRMKKTGTLKKGTNITVFLDARPVSSTKGGSKVWYRIYHNGSYSYVCSKYIKITGSVKSSGSISPGQDQIDSILNLTSGALSKLSDTQFENFLAKQCTEHDRHCQRNVKCKKNIKYYRRYRNDEKDDGDGKIKSNKNIKFAN